MCTPESSLALDPGTAHTHIHTCTRPNFPAVLPSHIQISSLLLLPLSPWTASAELKLEDTLSGHSPSRGLLLIEAALRSHRQVPGALRAPHDAQIQTARALSALVPRLALASLSAVNQRSQGGGASSSSSSGSKSVFSVEGFASVLSALCTVRKVSVSLMSPSGTEADNGVWDGILSGVLLEAIHTEEEANSGSLGSPRAEGAVPLLSSGACCPAAHLIQHRASALSLATAAMVQLLPPICSGVQNDLGKCRDYMKAIAGSVNNTGICQAAIHLACGCLQEWSRTLAWACSGPWMPGYPEHCASEQCSGACRPASGTDPDSDPAQEPVTPGCDSCVSFLAFERSSSLALIVGAVGVSGVPQLLGEAGQWLGMLLGLGLEEDDDTALASQLTPHLARSLDAVLGLAAAAVEASLGGDPMVNYDDAGSDGAASRADDLAAEQAEAARAACLLVVEVLQCGLLQQLASTSLMHLACMVEVAEAAAAMQKHQPAGKVPVPTGDPLASQMLGLVPVLFNRLALSLTRCIRALAASVEEGGILDFSGSGLQGPAEGPHRTPLEVKGLRDARCVVDRCVSRCSDGVEMLAIASCKLAVASTKLQSSLPELPVHAEPLSAQMPPAAARRAGSSRARQRSGVGLTPPQRTPEAAAAVQHDTDLHRCHSLVVALLGEALERWVTGSHSCGGTQKGGRSSFRGLSSLSQLFP